MVIHEGRTKSGNFCWVCKCECGYEVRAYSTDLRSGKRMRCHSCGNTTHGLSGTQMYQLWGNMIYRCTKETCAEWEWYGGRGIKVCDRWLGKNGFVNFMTDMGPRPKGKTLDRWPNKDGNYEPDNCRWASAIEQGRNRNGVKLSLNIAREIRARYATGCSQKSLAEQYNVTGGFISRIVHNQTWKE